MRYTGVPFKFDLKHDPTMDKLISSGGEYLESTRNENELEGRREREREMRRSGSNGSFSRGLRELEDVNLDVSWQIRESHVLQSCELRFFSL